MCKKATCGTCNKSTWWGCGQHVPMVMDPIPEEERCSCEPKVEKSGVQYPPMGPAFGMVKSLFGFGGGSSSSEGEKSDEL